MKPFTRTAWVIVLVAISPATAADYLREVKPILQARCFACHGALKQQSSLRLDTGQDIRRGGDEGPVVVPGDPDASHLIQRISSKLDSERMPPDGEPLTDEQVAAIRAWISEGAVSPENEQPARDPRRHWSFQPPARGPIPDLPRAGANSIDALLAVQQAERRLSPLPRAPKPVLLRRVYLDLIGLPPMPAEVREFTVDPSPDAYERVVDRLLASPRYGERWGRHWMDVWRYSDWYGLGDEPRFSHYHIWRWRDWIIESLNADLGYDQMIVQMLAGDEVAPDDPRTLRATGFLVRNWDIFNRNKWLDGTIEHTSRAFLGLTVQCARCHDHKFDPIGQLDYYRLRAVFEPYQIRIDRVPGQPDRNKDGLARVFDDLIDTPTHLLVRGDETQPDKSRSLEPASLAVLGGELHIHPIQLPLAARNPNKQAFVLDEWRDGAEQAVSTSVAAVEATRQAREKASQELSAAQQREQQALAALPPLVPSAAPGSAIPAGKAREEALLAVRLAVQARRVLEAAAKAVELAQAEHGAALAQREAVAAVLEVERLEDAGAREGQPAQWEAAARAATTSQRRASVRRAVVTQLTAEDAAERARRVLEGLTSAATDPKDPSLASAIEKATVAMVEAQARLASAARMRGEAEAVEAGPPSSQYSARPVEFPRAKMTYRDNPSTAPYPSHSTGRRLALARWIVDPANPLTARVGVNHVWARHFHEPLVSVMYDLGLRTPAPTHQALLDELSVDWIESSWSMKYLHRWMVTSEAYQLASSVEPGNAVVERNRQIDVDNRYYWRASARRMEAEVIRDGLLHLADRLDGTLGGKDLPVPTADDGVRRSIYYRYSRDSRPLFLTIFDAASVEECYRRHETIVPQQALAMTNSKMVLDRAEQIAQALATGRPPLSNEAFVVTAFEHILGRAPTPAERDEAAPWLDRMEESEGGAKVAGSSGGSAAEGGDGSRNTAAPGMTARAALVHVLLNHNDFVTIR